MEEIKNEDIFNRLFDTDEKILWSGKPIVIEKKMDEFTSFYIRLVVSIILGTLLSFLITILVPLTIPEVIFSGIILTIGILGLSSAITLVIRMEGGYFGNEALRDTEYFISNKRIFSLRNTFHGFILLINIVIIDIDYFFFEADCHLNLKITHKNEENLKNLILHCKPMKDIMMGEKCKVQIERDEGWEGWDWEWDALEKEAVCRLSNIGNLEVISKVLTDQLNIKENEPPTLWVEKYGVSEAHYPY